MSDIAERRREPHRCVACKARFEVAHKGNPVDPPVAVEVHCPECGKALTVSVPEGTQKDLLVETVKGPEAEVGGGG